MNITVSKEEVSENGTIVRATITLDSGDVFNSQLLFKHHPLYPKFSEWEPLQWVVSNNKHTTFEDFLRLLGDGNEDEGCRVFDNLIDPFLTEDRDQWLEAFEELTQKHKQELAIEQQCWDAFQVHTGGRF